MAFLYIKAKRFNNGVTTFDLEIKEGETLLQLEEDSEGKRLFVVNTESTPADFLARQHTEIEAVQVAYNEVADEIKSSAAYTNINEIVKNNIRKKYSHDDEIKLLNIALEVPMAEEYTDYRTYVAQCRAAGDVIKLSAGLKE